MKPVWHKTSNKSYNKAIEGGGGKRGPPFTEQGARPSEGHFYIHIYIYMPSITYTQVGQNVSIGKTINGTQGMGGVDGVIIIHGEIHGEIPDRLRHGTQEHHPKDAAAADTATVDNA